MQTGTKFRLLAKAAAALAVVYVLVSAGLFVAMRQPPETFNRVMKRVPMPAFAVLPFRPLWLAARAGQLEPGQPAPDFHLETLDKQQRVRLSDHRGRQPVVLVFGSYT